MSLTLIVLAAGSARRYGGLKQLAPVGARGEALLEYSVFDAVRAGFTDVVLVIQEGQESVFRERLDGGLGSAVATRYAFQRKDVPVVAESFARTREKPWGTGHAVLAAEQCVHGAFAVINADDFYGRDAYAQLADFLRDRGQPAERSGPERRGSDAVPEYAVVGFLVSQTLSTQGPVSRALLKQDEFGRLMEINELPAIERRDGVVRCSGFDGTSGTLHDDALVSMNIWGFGQSLFSQLEDGFRHFVTEHSAGPDASPDREFLLPDFVGEQVATGRAEVKVLPGKGPWTGLTFEADFRRTQRFLADLVEAGEYPDPLW